ncbi:MAG TPA: 2-amino-4-hydroxy-6-hydroxymethyldihydropteridine diphosphokinase [Arenimonas sp.]|nr:2-amino-4-hydroxy-6-hydroxymethyldihydropteridine diphosphokinase [Arenimonas sp.]
MMYRVFIGLGGNQGNSLDILKQAAMQIAALPGCHMIAMSSFYQSQAWGGIAQDDFVNAVLEISTELEPLVLLDLMLAIERNFGRTRQNELRWGPRSLDCDILLYGDLQLDSERLKIPHPRMMQRAFVLKPLAELDSHLVIAEFGNVSNLLAALNDQSVQKILNE